MKRKLDDFCVIIQIIYQGFKSSRPEVFCKKGVLKIFQKLKLHRSLFFNKICNTSTRQVYVQYYQKNHHIDDLHVDLTVLKVKNKDSRSILTLAVDVVLVFLLLILTLCMSKMQIKTNVGEL